MFLQGRVYKHLRLKTEVPEYDVSEVDFLECKSACLSNPDYCNWFSVNYDERICLLFESCNSLSSQNEYNPMRYWHSSHVCCNYYIEQ